MRIQGTTNYKAWAQSVRRVTKKEQKGQEKKREPRGTQLSSNGALAGRSLKQIGDQEEAPEGSILCLRKGKRQHEYNASDYRLIELRFRASSSSGRLASAAAACV